LPTGSIGLESRAIAANDPEHDVEPVHEREELKEYYQDDALARGYVAKRFTTARGRVIHRTQVAVINDIIQTHGLTRALELAPGPARATREIAGLRSGVAVDASPQMLEIARRAVDPRIWRLVEEDIFELSLGERFPLVYTLRFLRHLETEPRHQVYEVVRRHLEEGGFFVFDAPNVVVELPIRRAKPHLFPVYDMLWSREGLVEELATAGFRVERLVGCMKWHGVQRVVSKLSERVFNGVGTQVVGALDRLPGRQPLEWTVVCRG
jgi:SAM-dependent methyltransferase